MRANLAVLEESPSHVAHAVVRAAGLAWDWRAPFHRKLPRHKLCRVVLVFGKRITFPIITWLRTYQADEILN